MADNSKILTDDHVAELLAKEAEDCALKYSAMGLSAYTRARSPANKMKPNTRFLRHIIKETQNHNEALLAKEAAEAQARLQDLAEVEDAKQRRRNPDGKTVRRRQLGDISAILEGRKRKRRDTGDKNDDDDDDESHDKKRRTENGGGSSRSSRRREHGHRDRDRGSGHRHEKRRRDTDDESDDERRHRSRRKHRDRSQSPRERERERDTKKRRHRHRSPLGSEDKDRTRSRRDRSDSRASSGRRRRRPRSRQEDDRQGPSRSRDGDRQDDGSDPLEDIVGPLPPPPKPLARVRGRGTVSASSGIDGRFSSSYDPALDGEPDVAESSATGSGGRAGADDWEDELEAYRDRQKWKQQGAERLRTAGFSDDQVRKWERGGEKGIDDVRWAKAGEREWDRGKKTGADGVTTGGASWPAPDWSAMDKEEGRLI